MSPPGFPTRDIIQIINTLYIKRQTYTVLNDTQITLPITVMLVQIYYPTIIQTIFVHSF